MDTFWERAAHMVDRVFSLIYLVVALIVSHVRFEGRTLVLMASVPDQCLLLIFVSSTCKFNLLTPD